MPSQTDNTLNKILSKPRYDQVEDQIRQQRIREAEYILEPVIPAQPDRETELEYLEWLERDFRAQPWIAFHFKKQFGPKRVPYNNKSALQSQYNWQWRGWFLVGAALGWPLATRLGRSAQAGPGGVAVVPMNRWVDEWPNVSAGHAAKRAFRRWAFATCCVTGYAVATYMSDPSRVENRDYTRPDFKPKAAMVKDTSMIYDPQVLAQLEAHTTGGTPEEDKGKSALYRLFRPQDANWDVKRNPYSRSDPLASYNPADGSFPTLSNPYADHKA